MIASATGALRNATPIASKYTMPPIEKRSQVDPRRALRYRLQHAPLAQRPGEDRRNAERHTLEGNAVDRHRDVGILIVTRQVLCHRAGGERNRYDEH